jgi:hypothetical protein
MNDPDVSSVPASQADELKLLRAVERAARDLFTDEWLSLFSTAHAPLRDALAAVEDFRTVVIRADPDA